MTSDAHTNFSNGNGVNHQNSRGIPMTTGTMDTPCVSSLDSWNWLMHMRYVRGETQAAAEVARAQLQRSAERSHYPHYVQGLLLSDEARLQEALDKFQTCNRLDPSNIDNVKQIASCLFRQGRHKLAHDAYHEAERMSTKPDWEIYYWLAECESRGVGGASTEDGGVTNARAAVSAGGGEAAGALLARLLLVRGNMREAIDAYEGALQSSWCSSETLSSAGVVLARAGRPQRAFQLLSAALAADPRHPRALLALAAMMQEHGDVEAALSKYRLAAATTPNSPALWNNVGLCFLSKQKIVAAISCLKKSLFASPLNAFAAYNVGLALLRARQPASAFCHLAAAAALRPDLAPAYTALGVALSWLGDSKNSLRSHRRATSLAPADPRALLYRAHAEFHAEVDADEHDDHHLDRHSGASDTLLLLEDVLGQSENTEPQIITAFSILKAELEATMQEAKARENVTNIVNSARHLDPDEV